MSETAAIEVRTTWWRCRCGSWHQGTPRYVGALTGEGLVMHAPVPPVAEGKA